MSRNKASRAGWFQWQGRWEESYYYCAGGWWSHYCSKGLCWVVSGVSVGVSCLSLGLHSCLLVSLLLWLHCLLVIILLLWLHCLLVTVCCCCCSQNCCGSWNCCVQGVCLARVRVVRVSSQSSLALVWLARSVVASTDDVVDDTVAFVLAVVGGLAAIVLVAAVFGPFWPRHQWCSSLVQGVKLSRICIPSGIPSKE